MDAIRIDSERPSGGPKPGGDLVPRETERDRYAMRTKTAVRESRAAGRTNRASGSLPAVKLIAPLVHFQRPGFTPRGLAVKLIAPGFHSSGSTPPCRSD
jgi:hypothetical protein